MKKLKNPLSTDDVKNFFQEQTVNSQSNHWFALYPQDVPIVIKPKCLVQIMALEVFASDGDAVPPFIFPPSFTLIEEVYIVLGGGSAALDQEGGCWETLSLTKIFYTMIRKQENPVFAVKNFLRSRYPKHLGA